MQGWVKLQRKIQDHWIYQEKRKFSKYEAWLDMLMMASHKNTKFVLGKELIELSKGSFITSELKLMERWSWGKEKVRSFLKLLEDDQMITKISDRKKTLINICNYCIYHDYEEEIRPQTDHKQTDNGLSADTIKNVKNGKKVKKEYYAEFISFSDNEHGKLLDLFKTQERFNLAVNMLNNYKASSGTNYKSDYHVMIGWVKDEMDKKHPLPKQPIEELYVEPPDFLDQEWS
jgi:hypothetical protein